MFENVERAVKPHGKPVFGSYVYWTVHHLDSWIKRDQLDVTCFIISLFTAQHVWMLIHPFSGACDLFVELFHGLYCSGSMWVGVTLWFGWCGVVSGCRLKPEITQQISCKLLRMDVLTSETCWAVNNEIKTQVTSSWSLFNSVWLASSCVRFRNRCSKIYGPGMWACTLGRSSIIKQNVTAWFMMCR